MRELTVTIQFTKPCLGNIRRQSRDSVSGKCWPYFLLPRTPDNVVRFESRWWQSNLAIAAQVMCKHQAAVKQVSFDIRVQGSPRSELKDFYKRYFDSKRFVKHEAFLPGDMISISCVVPNSISDDDFRELMEIVGRFRGISPFGAGEYGLFDVVSVQRKYGNDDN